MEFVCIPSVKNFTITIERRDVWSCTTELVGKQTGNEIPLEQHKPILIRETAPLVERNIQAVLFADSCMYIWLCVSWNVFGAI